MDKDIIINIIKYIKEHESDTLEDFIKKNTDFYNDIVNEKKQINKESFIFLYRLIRDNISINDNLIYNIYKQSDVLIEQDIITESRLTKSNELSKIDNGTVLFLSYLSELYTFSCYPKDIILLWNDKNYIDVDRNVLLDSNTNVINGNIKSKNISYSYLLEYLSENIHNIGFRRKFRIYNNLNRIIGINTSTKMPKLKYLFLLKLSNTTYITCNIIDNIYTNDIAINSINYDSRRLENVINDNIDVFIKYIKKKYNTFMFERVFNSGYYLKCYIDKLYETRTPISIDLNMDHPIINVSLLPPLVHDISTCIHIEEYNKLFKKNNNNYYNDFLEFQNKYININRDISICRICGEELEIFNNIEPSYYKVYGQFVLTNVYVNIFSEDRYSMFVDTSVFMSNLLISYDNLFKSNRLLDYNNIARLIMDMMIHINDIRFECETKYAKEIKETDLFIVRLNINIFDVSYDQKEKYKDEKILNVYTISCLVTALTCTLNELLNIIVKNIVPINRNASTENEIIISVNSFLMNIVKKFLNKHKIKLQYPNSFHIVIGIYLDILIPELLAYYNILIKKFYNNIDILIANRVELVYSKIYKPYIDHYYLKDPFVGIQKNINYNQESFMTTPSIYKNKEALINIPVPDIDTYIVPAELYELIDLSYSDAVFEYKGQFIIESNIVESTKLIYVDTTRRSFFFLDDVLYANDFISKVNIYMKFFMLGNTVPFLSKILPIHGNLIVSYINFVINQFTDKYYIEIRITKTVSIEYYFLLYYTIFNYISKDINIKQWIEDNNSTINTLYNIILQRHSNM